MPTLNHLIALGASTGGLDAIRSVVSKLPANFPAAILIVVHISPESPNVMATVLGKAGPLPAATAENGSEIEPGHIYVAAADRHMLVHASGRIVLSYGPKENRFRPAIDPLFRSVAAVFGPRAIGVILTGNLDDGCAGLAAIREQGGITVVQNPEEAVAPGMPTNAIKRVEINHIVRLEDMPKLLVRLATEKNASPAVSPVDREMEIELKIAAEEEPLKAGVRELGQPSMFACPECHGVLLQLKDANSPRFRCHTGHAYSIDSLCAEFDEKIEESLWNAVRALDENVLLLDTIASQAEAHGHKDQAAALRAKLEVTRTRNAKVREALGLASAD